jgi:hypothetical protein
MVNKNLEYSYKYDYLRSDEVPHPPEAEERRELVID